MVVNETGSRIPSWRTLVFENGNSYISAANWDISTKFGLLIDFDLLKAVTSTNTKPEVVFSGRGRHLEKWIWRHISAADVPIWTKFGSLMQNDTPITAKWARSKPEVEFQQGGRLYFENGNSYISAANWDISTKFGWLIDIDLLKAVTSTNTKLEVVFSSQQPLYTYLIAGRLWPSEGRDINKYETGSSI